MYKVGEKQLTCQHTQPFGRRYATLNLKFPVTEAKINKKWFCRKVKMSCGNYLEIVSTVL